MTRLLLIAPFVSAFSLACGVDTTLPDLSEQLGSGPTDAAYCTTDELTLFPPETLQMHVIDVGQGDAIWIRTPYFDSEEFESRDILIDTGPSGQGDTSPGGEVVVDYMTQMGHGLEDPIDAVIITHDHADHYGGLPAIAEAFQIGQYYDPAFIGSDSSLRYTLQQAQEAAGESWGSPLDVSDGLALSEGLFEPTAVFGNYVDARLLWAADEVPNGSDANDTSIVLSVSWSARRILLMGDAEAHVEEALILAALAGDVTLTANVLKVGHHGSQTSSTKEFLDATIGQGGPDTWAIISSGRKRFGDVQLPAYATVEALRERLDPYHLLSTENRDEARYEGQEHGDDHVLVTIGPNGEVRACYVP